MASIALILVVTTFGVDAADLDFAPWDDRFAKLEFFLIEQAFGVAVRSFLNCSVSLTSETTVARQQI